MSTPFNFSPMVVHQFTAGDCWLLAWAMHRRYNLPIYVMSHLQDEPRYSWDHVVVRAQTGEYIDITGSYTAEEIEFRNQMHLHLLENEHTESFSALCKYLWRDEGTCVSLPGFGERYHIKRKLLADPAVIAIEVMEQFQSQSMAA